MDIPWLYCNFNSSVVRLKVKITIMNLVILKFQFQCGAIKSKNYNYELSYFKISIPVWCD